MTMNMAPRLWIGPDGRMLDCDDLDLSHSMTVVNSPIDFGLGHLAGRLARMVESEDFDFDHVIAMAERNGWTRTSRDAAGGALIAVSSGSGRCAATALRRLKASHGFVPDLVDVEISDLDERRLVQSYHRVEGRCLPPFLRHGHLPSPIHMYEKSLMEVA